MTQIPANVGSYRDRHGKQRWRYRKGEINVTLPGCPGDVDFEHTVQQAVAGLISQRPLRPSPARDSLLARFAREVLARVKYRSRAKGVPFDLTMDNIASLMETQDWRCAVSGTRFLTVSPSNTAFQPSLDRIEPSKGYVVGNVRIVCYLVNLAMNEWGEEPLIRLVRVMANRVANRVANL